MSEGGEINCEVLTEDLNSKQKNSQQLFFLGLDKNWYQMVSLLERCPHFRGWYVQASMELGPEDVSLLERCPHFRGWYVQASMEPEDVSILERCPHFRGWYVLASMEPEDVSLLERCPHF